MVFNSSDLYLLTNVYLSFCSLVTEILRFFDIYAFFLKKSFICYTRAESWPAIFCLYLHGLLPDSGMTILLDGGLMAVVDGGLVQLE